MPLSDEQLKKAALTTVDITKAAVEYFAQQGRKRIAEGRASIFDYFNVMYEQATPEERKKMLDKMAELHEEQFG